ncbi:MAG: DUF4236 domain-containing protein, partial [Proteobacteria bacterium]|nr:DUF4236 domain-containing protein [Pseudomonadota bacterium]
MGLRFNKRLKIAPGVKINIGLKGISTTIGGRGTSVSVGKKGTHWNAPTEVVHQLGYDCPFFRRTK